MRQAIRDDEDIRVVRVKNRLARDFDASTSVGYRDVLVNGRLCPAVASLLYIVVAYCVVVVVIVVVPSASGLTAASFVSLLQVRVFRTLPRG